VINNGLNPVTITVSLSVIDNKIFVFCETQNAIKMVHFCKLHQLFFSLGFARITKRQAFDDSYFNRGRD
jgi:hypothetical protein